MLNKLFAKVVDNSHAISARNQKSRHVLYGFYRYSFLLIFWRRHELRETDLRRLHGWLRSATNPVLTLPPAEDDTGRITIVRTAIKKFLYAWQSQIHGRVLDVGVGTWSFSRGIFASHCEYTSTDCFEHPNVDVVSDIHHLSDVFDSNNYNYIICTDVLEHVRRPWEAVAQMYSLLIPGGKLLLTTPFNYPLHGEYTNNLVNDYWRISEAGLRSLLVDFGEVDIQAIGSAGFPDCYLVVATK